MPNEALLLEKAPNGVVTLTLNRPDKMNALTEVMKRDMGRYFEQLDRDPEVKALIITGAGRGFCAGADVGGLAVTPSEAEDTARRSIMPPLGRWLTPLLRMGKPSIAAVNGPTAGIGYALALACDIRYVSEQARFIAAWIHRGLIPDGGATYMLPRAIGTSRAMELFYTGDSLSAAEAERIGLVSKVFPPDQLLPAARALADRLAKGPSVAIGLTKKAVFQSIPDDFEAQLYIEHVHQELCRQTEDYRESARAFMEKRPPTYQGK